MKNVIIFANGGRFGNQLYPIYTALSIPNTNNIYILDNKIPIDIFNQLPQKLREKVHIKSKYNVTDDDVILTGYCQNASKINTNIIRSYMECPELIKNKIFEYYGDLSEHVCLHIRRGDYVGYTNYLLLSVQYIEHVINTYCSNIPIICVSDDINWCKSHLNHLNNIKFADLHSKDEHFLIDFYIPTFTKCNVCSPSSFCMAGAMLNPNNNIYIPSPYYTYEPWNNDPELQIIPDYAIKIPYKMENKLNYILAV